MNILENDQDATDPIYIKIRDGYGSLEIAKKSPEDLKELYVLTKDLFDKDFCKRVKKEFVSCCAEMYFAAVMMDKYGYEVTRPSTSGPDLFLPCSNLWLEVTTASDGDENISKSTPQSTPVEEAHRLILRLTNAFCTKANQILRYLEKGEIEKNQPVVIGINGARMTPQIPIYPKGGFPPIVHAVLPVSDPILSVNKKENTTEIKFNYRDQVNKHSGAKVNTDYFLQDHYSHISAVIYSYATVGRPGITRDNWGCDFFTVHNPQAKNPLPENFIQSGKEYFTSNTPDEFSVRTVDHQNLNK